MKKVAIVGAGEFQIFLIEKAKKLGYETYVFAWEDGAVGKEVADHFYSISIRDQEKILETCAAIHIDGITSIGSDLAVPTVNYVANNLGLTGNSMRCALVSTDKFEMRKVLKRANISTPTFQVISAIEDIDLSGLSFPMIVKPVDRSGNRGVTKINSEKDLTIAVKEAINQSFDNKAIVEEYLEGEEYSCESISYKGKHHRLAYTKKFTVGEPYFVERAHIQPASFTEIQKENIYREIEKALTALEIENGASHCEFKIDANGKVKIIEIGSRMGGGCIGSHLVPLSTGYDYMRMVLEIACGQPLEIMECEEKKAAAIRFLINQQDYDILSRIQGNELETIKLIYMKNNHLRENQIIRDSSDRNGFYILQSGDYKDLLKYMPGEDQR